MRPAAVAERVVLGAADHQLAAAVAEEGEILDQQVLPVPRVSRGCRSPPRSWLDL
jgi:hypothetical protein